VQGLWVFGLSWSHDNCVRRYFIVDKRDGEILLSIIKSEVDIGSTIY